MPKRRPREKRVRKERKGKPGRPAALPPRPELTAKRAGLLLAGAAVIVVAVVFLVPSDRLATGYDWFQNWRFHKEFIRSTLLEHGTVPLWCRWSLSGMPFLANPQTMLFYPGTLLYVLLPAGWALPIDTIVHFALGAVGMLLFCRARGLPLWAGTFAGVGVMACGFNLAHATVGHIHYFASVAWLPFVFLAVEKWVSTRSMSWIALGAGSVALQFFAGALPVVWMTMLFGGLYGAGRIVEDWLGRGREGARDALRVLAGLALIFALGLLVCSAQILPTRELAASSLRSDRGYAFSAKDALPVGELGHLVAPGRLGPRLAWEFYGYAGLAPWVLAAGAVASGRLRRGGWTLLGLSGLALVLMLGDATPLFRILYATVPGLSLFRVHAREVLMLAFCLAALGASGLAAAAGAGDGAGRPGRPRWIVGAGLAVSAAAVLLTLAGPGGGGTELVWLVLAVGSSAAAVLLTLAGPGGGGTELVWLALAVGSVVAATRVGAGKRWSIPLFVLLFAAELLAAERVVRDRLTIPTRLPDAQEELAGVLRADEGNYRFWFPRRHFLSNQGYAERRGAIEGYENMILSRYRAFIHGMTGAPVKPDVITILTQSNFRYAPSPFPFKVLNVKYAAMPDSGGGYRLHKNPNAVGPAFLVERHEVLPGDEILRRMASEDFDPRDVVLFESDPPGAPAPAHAGSVPAGPPGEAAVVEVTPNRVRIAADVRREAFLVSSEIHAPGWRVEVNGARRPLLRADYILRAVHLPPGRHEVAFVYRPASLLTGLALSAAGVIACAGLMLAGWRSRRRSASAPSGPTARPAG